MKTEVASFRREVASQTELINRTRQDVIEFKSEVRGEFAGLHGEFAGLRNDVLLAQSETADMFRQILDRLGG